MMDRTGAELIVSTLSSVDNKNQRIAAGPQADLGGMLHVLDIEFIHEEPRTQ
jgi:hypothetical protein